MVAKNFQNSQCVPLPPKVLIRDLGSRALLDDCRYSKTINLLSRDIFKILVSKCSI